MSQPPQFPILAHENVRNIPALSQKTFYDESAGAVEFFAWEFDLGLRVTDPNQFIVQPNPAVLTTYAPTGGGTLAGGGAGPQTTPQPAIGPWLDWVVYTDGAGGGQMTVQYAVDAAPCSYVNIFDNAIPSGIITNSSGLRVTGRFVRLVFRNNTAGAVVQCGYYIRSWS